MANHIVREQYIEEYERTPFRLFCLPRSPYSGSMIVCRLKEVLKRRGWTRYRLQKESGVTYQTIHHMFRGRSKLYSTAVLEKICRSLRCQPGDLLRRQDESPRREKGRGKP